MLLHSTFKRFFQVVALHLQAVFPSCVTCYYLYIEKYIAQIKGCMAQLGFKMIPNPEFSMVWVDKWLKQPLTLNKNFKTLNTPQTLYWMLVSDTMLQQKSMK
jgi:hypothetical protein